MIRSKTVVLAALGLAVTAGAAFAQCAHSQKLTMASTTVIEPVEPITTAQAPVATPIQR